MFQKMMTSYADPQDILRRLNHSGFNAMGSGEVYVGAKELSNDLVNHKIPTQTPVHIEMDPFDQHSIFHIEDRIRRPKYGFKIYMVQNTMCQQWRHNSSC